MESIFTIIFFGLAVVFLAMWLAIRSMARMPSLQTIKTSHDETHSSFSTGFAYRQAPGWKLFKQIKLI